MYKVYSIFEKPYGCGGSIMDYREDELEELFGYGGACTLRSGQTLRLPRGAFDLVGYRLEREEETGK